MKGIYRPGQDSPGAGLNGRPFFFLFLGREGGRDDGLIYLRDLLISDLKDFAKCAYFTRINGLRNLSGESIY